MITEGIEIHVCEHVPDDRAFCNLALSSDVSRWFFETSASDQLKVSFPRVHVWRLFEEECPISDGTLRDLTLNSRTLEKIKKGIG